MARLDVSQLTNLIVMNLFFVSNFKIVMWNFADLGVLTSSPVIYTGSLVLSTVDFDLVLVDK